MPIVHMAQSYQEATERGINVHLYHDSQVNDWQLGNSQEKADGPWTYLHWLYETHHGLCIHEREHNGYDDSDFYMVVWNPETNKPQSIEFASTRGWSYPCYASRPDATPEVLAKFEAYQDNLRREEERAYRDRLARTPAKGKILKVVKGRKVPKGIIGLCIWLGRTAYGERVGIKTDSGEVYWTALSNVEVTA